MQSLGGEQEYTGARSVLALGTFDGVHIGHARLLRAARALADELEADCVVCSFDRHPLAVLDPAREPKQLTTPEERCAKFARLGADYALLRPFTPQLAAIPARDYLTALARNMRAAGIVVGESHRFGFKGRGDARLIEEMGARLGYRAVIVPPVYDQGQLVSSSLIRSLFAACQAERALRLLKID